MNKPTDNQEIKCPSCLSNSPISRWKAEHKQGELAKVACPNCGLQPKGKALVLFRSALALKGLLTDLEKRHNKRVTKAS